MNIKKDILLLILIFSLTGCSTVDPSPYLFDPRPLPSLEEQAKIREARRRKLDNYILQHPELTDIQKTLIRAGLIGEGLTREQTVLLYGKEPDKIEKENLKYDADEMWFYRSVWWNDYFYFKDDVLIKIDHKR